MAVGGGRGGGQGWAGGGGGAYKVNQEQKGRAYKVNQEQKGKWPVIITLWTISSNPTQFI